MRTLNIALYALFFLASSYLFYFFPEIDIGASNLFYNQQGFYLVKNPIVHFVHRAVPVICVLTAAVVGVHALKIFIKTRSLKLKLYKKHIYFILVCALGAGFVVHNIIKDSFNRARPNAIVEFNGHSKFTPAFVVSDQCNHNCSFVSGHSAAGFMFFALAFLFKTKRERVFYTYLGFILGSGFGLVRVMEGGHFLSDVVFAGFTMYMVAYALAIIMKPHLD